MLGQSSASNTLRCRSELWAVTCHSNLAQTARNFRISTNCRTYDVRVECEFDLNTKLIPTGEHVIKTPGMQKTGKIRNYL